MVEKVKLPISLLEEVSQDGMSKIFGGCGADKAINNGTNCNDLNNGSTCDVINNGTNCSVINNNKNCGKINNRSTCQKGTSIS